jgi:GrpB-like predicted nucleotidyltransferase (UPF0157 family)
MSSVIIVDYDPTWPQQFEEEKVHILATISDYITEVEHIGSTSIPGLGAKPIIDIMVVIRDPALVECCIEPLRTLGYEYMGEYGVPGRHYFRKPGGEAFEKRTHHLHMYEKGHEQRALHLLFREYLRMYPESARRYDLLKRELATTYASDREAYTEAKTEFIRSIIRASIEEAFAKREGRSEM